MTLVISLPYESKHICVAWIDLLPMVGIGSVVMENENVRNLLRT